MSNVITVEYIKFQNINDKGQTVCPPTFGYTVDDSYASYCNRTFDSIEDVVAEINEENMVEVINGIEGFDGAVDSCNGIRINGTFFGKEELDKISSKV